VDFWTGKPVREVKKCHLNFAVSDTQRWEQSAAARIDKHLAVKAFVKNDRLGFAIPYLHDGQQHEYIPDYLVRLRDEPRYTLILELKGHPDALQHIKAQAAERWVAAVNADGQFGTWAYVIVRDPTRVSDELNAWEAEAERVT
jgi:type III restriction enzyme